MLLLIIYSNTGVFTATLLALSASGCLYWCQQLRRHSTDANTNSTQKKLFCTSTTVLLTRRAIQRRDTCTYTYYIIVLYYRTWYDIQVFNTTSNIAIYII